MTFNDQSEQFLRNYCETIWENGWNLRPRKILEIIFRENGSNFTYAESNLPDGLTYYTLMREDRMNDPRAIVITYLDYNEDPDNYVFSDVVSTYYFSLQLYYKLIERLTRPYSPNAQPLAERNFIL